MTYKANDEIRRFTAVGCFRVGSKVYRGNGTKVLTITAIESWNGKDARAKLNQGVWYPLKDLVLAIPGTEGQ
ncbi:hypothetical protein UFOVP345_24 [uncultured Caudovirales phage]|uniref:Uncharacterized protein n=1 Tax=uncultured Caudovirales phage TaxID=2100421 RepID=A0A6J5M1J6_9CAUD|nr:hypothetical protein UFOVP345_24 [uncultured Caudovirales phage]